MGIQIGRGFVILRSFEVVESRDRIPIVLGPGRAFGSGEHETTRSCLEELEEMPNPAGAKVLDLGCGTAILSIAAAKLGAQAVLALDPDRSAIEAAKANIRLNRLTETILAAQGDLTSARESCFDIVAANLYGDILLGLAEEMQLRLAPGGTLLVSGVAYEYVFDLKTNLGRAGIQIQKSRFLDDYCTFVGVRA